MKNRKSKIVDGCGCAGAGARLCGSVGVDVVVGVLVFFFKKKIIFKRFFLFLKFTKFKKFGSQTSSGF